VAKTATGGDRGALPSPISSQRGNSRAYLASALRGDGQAVELGVSRKPISLGPEAVLASDRAGRGWGYQALVCEPVTDEGLLALRRQLARPGWPCSAGRYGGGQELSLLQCPESPDLSLRGGGGEREAAAGGRNSLSRHVELFPRGAPGALVAGPPASTRPDILPLDPPGGRRPVPGAGAQPLLKAAAGYRQLRVTKAYSGLPGRHQTGTASRSIGSGLQELGESAPPERAGQAGAGNGPSSESTGGGSHRARRLVASRGKPRARRDGGPQRAHPPVGRLRPPVELLIPLLHRGRGAVVGGFAVLDVAAFGDSGPPSAHGSSGARRTRRGAVAWRPRPGASGHRHWCLQLHGIESFLEF